MTANEPQPPNDLPTLVMHQLLDRVQQGDARASDELLRRIGARMEAIARRMLRRFPAVERWEQIDDVVQGATLRLLRALQQIRPESTRAFFGLAVEQIRRELIDLARHYHGPHGWGANYQSGVLTGGAVAPAAPDEDREDLERWTALHEAVARLPVEEREVFGLTYYHGWGQKEIAELIGKDERTVRRKWRSACVLLHEVLQGHLPHGADEF
jgi:RNA polymerase sigma-70 factor (ECF subfamily)